ncbi:neurogenic locus Notch protein, partial [Aplysia californica]|uniref:Neurogenic locus Notch protein n=1 Tax=Aplysia californica TaxID=6500 RepID=A0ABM1AFE6_APLCA
MRSHVKFLVVFLGILSLGTLPLAKGFPSCSPNPCKHGMPCKTTADGSRSYCDCGDRYMGEYCTEDNPCWNDYCLNEATCEVVIKDNGEAKAECTCPIGFEGLICEIIDERSACYRNPCQNGGKCIIGNSLDQYTCECMTGYRGKHC